MANTPDYSWPPMESRKLIGKPIKRLDGPQKAAGRAKYASDKKFPGMLHACYLTSPHAHAKVNAIDTSASRIGVFQVCAMPSLRSRTGDFAWHSADRNALKSCSPIRWRAAARMLSILSGK